MHRAGALACLTLVALAVGWASPSARADTLRVGVGRADITPPTGYFLMGNVRADAPALGSLGRLSARAIVLQKGDQKVALVVEDLGGIAGGTLTEASKLLADRGFGERNMIVSATHTHSSPGQYWPYGLYNTSFPNVTTPTSYSVAPDPQLYGFLARRLAVAIARADDDLGPGAAAWGRTKIPYGLTENRSIEAHLANFGIRRDFGQGRPEEDPKGLEDTIDPDVDVLRVDKRIRGKLVPVGMWSTFANHGTVELGILMKSYATDHFGPAMTVSESAVRRAGGAPPGQDVVSAFSNADEGDITSGLQRTGPAAAEWVGRVEAAALMRAWKQAGRALSATPALALRWTRFCFCGQETEGGRVDDKAVPGVTTLTGSDEHRGQLYENTGLIFEGRRLPAEIGPQGNKIQFQPQGSDAPKAPPLAALMIGDGVIVTVPGEATVETGRRIKAAVLGALPQTGVQSVAIAGLANEYTGYFTTPDEFAWQPYEAGVSLWGKYASNLLRDEIAKNAGTIKSGAAAPAPYVEFDPTNGAKADPTPFPEGAASGSIVTQPTDVERLGHTGFAWRGGPRGVDRPLDRPFITVQHKRGRGWVDVYSDLRTSLWWGVDGDQEVPLGPGYAKQATTGTYTATWEIPIGAAPGDYRMVVTANRYRLESRPFAVKVGAPLTVVPVRAPAGRAAFTLDYPVATPYADFTWRPISASGGTATVRVGGKRFAVRVRRGQKLSVPARAGAKIVVAGARDRYGNRIAKPLSFVAGSVTEDRHAEPFPKLDRTY
jgi:neutral ceramidase